MPTRTIGLLLAVAILVLAGACATPEPTATAIPTTVPATATSAPAPSPTASPPPTTTPQPAPATPQSMPDLEGKVDVGDHRLYIHCTGTGAPAVILEAGYNDTSETWSLVQPEVAANTRVCAYDRAGLGHSLPGPMSESSLEIVTELHTLLLNAGVEGPYVLVGHSWGGETMRLYAGLYAQDVAGLVLVDSSHPDQFRRMAAVLPPESPSDSESLKFYRDWISNARRDPAQTPELYAPGSLGDLPLVVLSAPHKERADDFPTELNDQLNQIWMELQEELAALSTNSSQVISEKSQHFIQQDEPDLVIDAILRVLSAASEADASEAGVADIIAGLQGLDIDDFFEASYRQLQLRDPDALVANGRATTYGVVSNHFTDRSDVYLRESQELETAILDLLRGYDRDSLSPEQALSYDVYEWYLDDRVRGQAFAYHDYPVNPLTVWGAQNWLIDFMANRLPLDSQRDAEDYVERLSQIDDWVEQVLEGLQQSEQAGIIPPRFLLQATRRQVEGHLKMQGEGSFDVEAIELYASFREKLEGVEGTSAEDKQALLDAARSEVENTFIPAYQALGDYLAYLETMAGDEPSAQRLPDGAHRLPDGAHRLPDGGAYYAYALRRQTGSDLAPDEVHALGLAEVARLQAEIRTAAVDLGYPPDVPLAELNERLSSESEVFSGEALLAEYERLVAGAEEAARAYFDLLPSAGLAIEPEPFGSGMAYYIPPPLDGSGPGVFYTNLALELEDNIIPTFVYHETIPGHHLQGALARELDLPTFRRELELNGYAEGWALYAERLAWEMGLYDDNPRGNLGRLQFELSRAARLVIDTGIHAKGWTREQAAAYYEEATGVPASPAAMNRYVILPGQGCGYTLGLLKILELRQRAMDQLGEAFEIREFHNVVLGNGPLPLDILERLVDEWIESRSVTLAARRRALPEPGLRF